MRRRWMAFMSAVLMTACGRGTVSRDPNPKNELPFGYVDVPAAGATVGHQMLARGWALDDGSVSEVRIFLDNHFIARTTITESRPDVTKVYPAYAHGMDVHGWTVLVPLAADTAIGPHTVLVQAVDDQGATRDIGLANVSLAR